MKVGLHLSLLSLLESCSSWTRSHGVLRGQRLMWAPLYPCAGSVHCKACARALQSDVPCYKCTLARSLALALSLALTRSLALSNFRSLALSLSRSLALSLSRALARSLSRSLALSLSRSLAVSLSLSRSLSLARARALSLSHSLPLSRKPGKHTPWHVTRVKIRTGAQREKQKACSAHYYTEGMFSTLLH
jgi:hypothetical protein